MRELLAGVRLAIARWRSRRALRRVTVALAFLAWASLAEEASIQRLHEALRRARWDEVAE